MRLAVYNVENLFDRAKAMNLKAGRRDGRFWSGSPRSTPCSDR